jgi:hypothetical protein
VVCYPQNELWDRVAWKPTSGLGENERDDIEAIARHEQFYKLTSFNGEKLKFGYLCSVQYGPWSAVVIEEGPCTDGMPKHFLLFVVSIPELALEWYGNWDDVPSYPSLHTIKGHLHLTKEVFFCCDGFVWCDANQSCVAEGSTFDCGPASPT